MSINLKLTMEHVCSAGFVLGAPCLLAVRLWRPRTLPWTRILIICIAWGWIMATLSVELHRSFVDEFYDGVGESTIAHPVASSWPHIFSTLTGNRPAVFGWALGPEYLIFCLAPFLLMQYLLVKNRDSTRAASIFLAIILVSLGASCGFVSLYAEHLGKKPSTIAAMDTAFVGLISSVSGALMCWLCVLCVVALGFLSSAIVRGKPTFGVLSAGFGVVMGYLAAGFL